MLIYNIIFMLIITLIIASITLLERKILSLIQRRVGPNFVGYRGRLQYLADALKLFVKGIIVPNEISKFWYICIPSITAAICYTFWINSVWGYNISILDIEYNLVYTLIISIFFSYCIILTGYFSKNKYALLSSIRCSLISINLEIFLGLMILNCILLVNSFCFSIFNLYQEEIWFIFIFFFILSLIIIMSLLETNRSPFDLVEAESELITGYTIEYGGFYFALYYLGEYFHLFFFSAMITTLILGGWELPNFFYFLFYYSFYFL